MSDTVIHSHFVTVGTRRVHYRRAGSGPLVIMLHPSPSWAKALDPYTRVFAERFTAIAMDTPGYGHSQTNLGFPSMWFGNVWGSEIGSISWKQGISEWKVWSVFSFSDSASG